MKLFLQNGILLLLLMPTACGVKGAPAPKRGSESIFNPKSKEILPKTLPENQQKLQQKLQEKPQETQEKLELDEEKKEDGQSKGRSNNRFNYSLQD